MYTLDSRESLDIVGRRVRHSLQRGFSVCMCACVCMCAQRGNGTIMTWLPICWKQPARPAPQPTYHVVCRCGKVKKLLINFWEKLESCIWDRDNKQET